ncbi:MAG: lamin tail domain-containing protein, partial [Nitrosopumilaceae archaeon]
DISATVQLKNKNGTVIDQTPLLRDIENNFNSWQRTADGLDTDSTTDWAFKTSNAGSSNGKLSSSVTEAGLSISVSTDKTRYLFGEAVKITGQVTKKVSVPNQPYTPEKVTLVISGPLGFQKTITIYPDPSLSFKTEMRTDKALKVQEGDYKVSVKYAGATSIAPFAIGEKAFVPPQKEASSIISIRTDKLSYIPGENAIISGNTSKIIPFTGMKFKVFDPNKKQVYDGTLYPNTKGQFSVGIFVNNVNPVFGKYNIIATYDTETTQTSYELVPEIKENTLISLTTDKAAYGLGGTVIITGRSNKVWIPSFDIEIVQAFAKKDIIDTLRIKDIIRLEGDGTFKYELKIPNKTDRYGDYKVIVSKEIGSAQTFFKVVENPAEFVAVEPGPLSISTDKLFYNIGDPLVVTGKVTEKKDFGRQTVKISITGADGQQIISKGDPRGTAGKNQDAAYSFTGVPDSSGNFEIKSSIYRNIFEKGTYLLKATFGDLKASTSFSVEDILDLGAGVKIIASTDKELYGIGEEVKLTGKVSTFTAQSSYEIILTDPDGKETSTTVLINNGLFSWSRVIP